MNFLYQASALYAAAPKPRVRRVSRIYASTFKRVASRNVLRIAPAVKHKICKQCDSFLVAGISAEYRYMADQQSNMEVKCGTCGLSKRFLMEKYLRRSPVVENTEAVLVVAGPPAAPAASAGAL
jgi:RNase P subunit RPR2